MTSITINLPEPKLEQLELAALSFNKPTSEVVTDMVLSALPPLDDVPEEMRFELLQMSWADTPHLWQIAKGQMDVDEQQRMQVLVQQQVNSKLDTPEMDELEELRRQYGRATLRKAHAYMLLSLRGGQPLLKDL